jgi:hypothetical protein
MTAVPSPTSNSNCCPQTPLIDHIEPVREQPSVVERQAHGLNPGGCVLIALMWALSSAALADPRPKAILAIAKTISQRIKI